MRGFQLLRAQSGTENDVADKMTEETVSGSKQAKASFEEYRQRMWAAYGPHAPAPPPEKPEKGSGTSLVEGIGTMLRLGVELINLGLQGGTQLLQGMYGPAGHMGHEHSEGCRGCHCLYESHGCDCYPGVHNCGG